MEKNSSPLVSVCIPSYNYSAYIPSAIESVLGQTYQNFELIIIDDCSTDNTYEIVQKYAAQNMKIRYYKNKINVGMVENWNLCLKQAAGDFIKVMGADDLLEPTCIEKSVSVLIENPHVSLVACARLLIDKDSHPISTAAYSYKFQILSGSKAINKCFFTANLIGEPVSVLFRKKDASRGFDPRYRQLTDLEMWFYLLEKGDFAIIPELLCGFRMHPDQATKANMRTLTLIDDENLLYRDYIEKAYLGKTFFHNQRWKFKICITIWTHKSSGLDNNTIHSMIRRYIPLSLFYPLVYLAVLKGRMVQLFNKIRQNFFNNSSNYGIH